jgi:hypothetical protein
MRLHLTSCQSHAQLPRTTLCTNCDPSPTQIHSHSAFNHRGAAIASLVPHLHGASQPRCPDRAPAVLITSCAVEGCLQLVFTASTLDGSDPFALPPGDNLSAFFCQLHSQLPASCVDDLVTIHLDDTIAVFKGGAGQQLPPELLHLPGSGSGQGLQCAPICFEAGSKEVEVGLTSDIMGEGLEAVVQCRRQGEKVVVKPPLRRVAGSTGCIRWVKRAWLARGAEMCGCFVSFVVWHGVEDLNISSLGQQSKPRQ